MNATRVIGRRKHRKAISLYALIGLVLLSSWYYYRWYNTGSMPPLPMPLVSAAQSGISTEPVTDVAKNAYSVSPTRPRYLTIPSLGVTKTRITEVGLTRDGNLDVPKNVNDTAWYKKSALPGSGTGAVLIDGHSGGYAVDGVFAKLKNLRKGETIVLERGDGKKLTYEVVENQTMTLAKTNESGMKRMLQPADPDKEGLNLITCAGVYVPKIGQFSERVLLRAVRVN